MLNTATQDPINPPAYIGDGIELIDVVEQYGLPFHLAAALQHIVAADHKGDREKSIEHARWYVERWLQNCHDNCAYPDPLEDCLEWHNPQDIIKAFGLEGNLAIAVNYILQAAAFECDEELEIQKALIALEAE